MEETDELLHIFFEEAREHLPIIESCLLSLEEQPEDIQQLNELFRSVHTIKGGAGFFALKTLSNLAHKMETLLSLARNGQLLLNTRHIDVLLNCQELMVTMIESPQESKTLNTDLECQQLDAFLSGDVPTNQNPPSEIETPVTEEKTPVLEERVSEKVLNHDEGSELEDTLQQPIKTANSGLNLDENDLVLIFIEEASECLPAIERNLLALEIRPDDKGLINEVFRHVHTIKGGAGFLNLEKIAQLTHIVEDVLGLAKSSKLELSPQHLDILLESYDVLKHLITDYQADADIDIASLCQRLEQIKQPDSIEKTSVNPSFQSLQQVREALPPDVKEANPVEKKQERPEPTQPLALAGTAPPKPSTATVETNHPQPLIPNIETEESIRVHVKRLNKLIDLAGELVLVRNQFVQLCEPLIPQVSGLKVTLHNFSRITTEMQEEIMSTRMQPVGIIFNKFPRLIRQLEKDLGKKIDLITEGADVELDKTIIESLNDPVTHIIRNMVDHGIETPEERLKRNKPVNGTLVQKAFHESGQVIIQFTDDGAGIDPDFIGAKALQNNIVTSEELEAMSVKEKVHLIFTAGFSTAEQVSSVSGRGIGMDVVKTNIEACGGTIDINSELGKWTSITMTLPLTMAIISALIVRVKNCRFAFPQGNLEEMVLLEAEDYPKRVGNVGEQLMLSLRGNFLPLIPLAKSLSMTCENDFLDPIENHKPLHILIIKSDCNKVAVIVEQIIGSEEIVVKPMPEYFKQIKNFSGTSILGDGTIALIIDVQGYIQRKQMAVELQKHAQEVIQSNIEHEPQPLLIFDNNTEEHFALALSWIQRIDSLDVKRIQTIAENEYIEYRGEQVRLLRLENYLPVKKPQSYAEIANIIIPKHCKLPVALLINQVIDTKNTVIQLEKSTIKSACILGSMLLEGKITLVLDMHNILELGEPESIEKVELDLDEAHSKHILIVEDTPFFMKVINDCVETAGYRVTKAVNGREGLDALEREDFDLVLTDIEMPIMDGREMVKNIRANPKWETLPVVALTTLNDSHIIAEGKRMGFNEWLVKLDKELVLKTLAQYLQTMSVRA